MGSVIVSVEIGVVVASRGVPAAPDHRVALRRQERARGIARGRGIVAARGAIEVAEELGAPVGRFVEDFMVALAQIDRLQDVEIEGVFDLAGGVARRKSRRQRSHDCDGRLG